jgi:hypothetical protein
MPRKDYPNTDKKKHRALKNPANLIGWPGGSARRLRIA